MEPWLQILIPLAIIFVCGFCTCCLLWDHRREIEREHREDAEKQANNLELGPINSGTIAIFLKIREIFYISRVCNFCWYLFDYSRAVQLGKLNCPGLFCIVFCMTFVVLMTVLKKKPKLIT